VKLIWNSPADTSAAASAGWADFRPTLRGISGYTEAPDETAHGDWMKLMASAGLAFDYVHYVAGGDLRVSRTEREAAGGVQWRVERARPILPPGVKATTTN